MRQRQLAVMPGAVQGHRQPELRRRTPGDRGARNHTLEGPGCLVRVWILFGEPKGETL